MPNHYVLTNKTISVKGITLYQIKATKRFSARRATLGMTIDKGTLGGYVESERNLEQGSNAWIDTDARVYGNARVRAYAYVSGQAEVYGAAVVEGTAWVHDLSKVSGQAHVYGNAVISGLSHISAKATVMGHASVVNSKVSGDAVVKDEAELVNAKVKGHAVVCCHARVSKSTVCQWACVGEYAVVEDSCRIEGKGHVSGNSEIRYRCTVGGFAVIQGAARIYDGSVVEGGIVQGSSTLKQAVINKSDDYICVGPIGSRSDYTTYCVPSDLVICGCFEGGLDSFRKAVNKTHGNNEHGQAYKLLVTLFRNARKRHLKEQEGEQQ